VLAVGTQGVVHWQLLNGSANSATFADFIRTLPAQSHARHEYILMDNVAFHKSKVVAAALAGRQLAPLFTPPYSPEFNPIEMAFSAFKAHMRKLQPQAGDTAEQMMQDMRQRVASGAQALGQVALSNMFRHVWQLCVAQNIVSHLT
jgi:transposase